MHGKICNASLVSTPGPFVVSGAMRWLWLVVFLEISPLIK